MFHTDLLDSWRRVLVPLLSGFGAVEVLHDLLHTMFVSPFKVAVCLVDFLHLWAAASLV